MAVEESGGMNHEDSRGVALGKGMSVAHMTKKDVL